MTGWQDRAACQGEDPEIFYQDDVRGRPGQSPRDPHAEARTICAGCDVILQCRKWATDNREHWFAGGMTADERKADARRKARGGTTPATLTRDDETTRERLHREGLSDRDIAAIVGCASHIIRDWRYARGYESNVASTRPIPQWRLDLYESLWQSGATDKQIAELAKVNVGSVKGWRKRMGHTPNRRAPVTCSVDGCGDKPHANGWCNTHYQRAREHGDPLWVPVSSNEYSRATA